MTNSDGVNLRREFPSSLGIQVWDSIPTAFPRSITTNDTTPENQYQSLMEAAPNAQPVPPKADAEALREAVASIVDLLPRKERIVIEALFYERNVSIRELARRLDMPRTSVSRLRDRAMKTLEHLLSTNNTITRKLNMEPTTWEEAARTQLLDLIQSTFHVQNYSDEAEDAINAAYVHYCDMSPRMWEEFANAGRIAWDWLIKYHESNEATLFEEMITLLVRRQAKYGHANILKFEELGLCVRMSDKVARICNLEEGGRSFDDESIVDTWMDVVGYAVIAAMLNHETFQSPLELLG